jgi:hypothetical protein
VFFENPSQSPDVALSMRFKIEQPGGFLTEYSVGVLRGSATSVPLEDITAPIQPLSLTYSEPVHGDFFYGTFNGVSPDGDAYVVAELQPVSGAWLPAGKNFCDFAFEIYATPRTTDGYGLGIQSRLDVELIGISDNAPPGLKQREVKSGHPMVILMGSGLLGLARLGRRRSRKS